MRPITRTLAAVATDAWIPVDMYVPNPALTIDLSFVTGPATFQVDYTMDDPFTVASPAVAGQLVASASAASNTVVNRPVRALRLNVTALTAGSVTMKVIQQGTQ